MLPNNNFHTNGKAIPSLVAAVLDYALDDSDFGIHDVQQSIYDVLNGFGDFSTPSSFL